MAEGRAGFGEAAPGDHLQTGYQLWLVGHQLEHGRAPWRDPYSFQPETKPRWNFAGWPFGFVYWPLGAFGAVLGWNAFVLFGFLGAGGLTAYRASVTQYSMLETLRDYALAHLDQRAERAARTSDHHHQQNQDRLRKRKRTGRDETRQRRL